MVHAVHLFRADAAIVTGAFTGDEPSLADVLEAKEAGILPILLGSGVSPDNIERYWEAADGFIVGSYFKQDAYWANPIEPGRVEKLVAKVRSLR